METQRVYIDDIQHPDDTAIAAAARLLQQGEIVAFPTETVYGLGANAFDPQACAKIYAAKGRPADNPLILHVCSLDMARSLALEWPEAAERCARKFWPGPLTLVVRKRADIPDEVTGYLPTVGIRFPAHPVALALIRAAGFPIAAPSANLSGKPSPTSGRHTWRDLQGKIPLILDAGSCIVGLESTVLDLTSAEPAILRPGGVTREQLAEVLGVVRVDGLEPWRIPKAPGMKYRHYAPLGEMYLFVGSRENIVQVIREEMRKWRVRGKKIGILCTLESVSELNHEWPDFMYAMGSQTRPAEVAANLFEGLRLCDERKIDVILAEGVEESGLGLAIMNRLEKAAGHKLIRV
ncbi:MAG: threonylcarbamoyl-AMP synthase [Peptococcaceae bacterium]|jgi:L-threonylcarbamoyladenylate synthase|nr:threonylcarbamoyl-AMP synthase [Peptococcaceae bacterium]